MTGHQGGRPAAVTVAKICGLTRTVDATHAEASGAAYLGVILASGPRLLDVDRAAAVLGPRRHGVRRVAIFGHRAPDDIIRVVTQLDLDVAQLHGEPSVRDVEHIRRATNRAVWPVVRVDGTTLPDDAADLAAAAGALVLDAKVVGQLGGTGVALDWSGLQDAIAALRRDVPAFQFVLAGGLRPENVALAIRLLSPQVADVSSGVEVSPGVKDPVAVERFVKAVQDVTGNAA